MVLAWVLGGVVEREGQDPEQLLKTRTIRGSSLELGPSCS